ncbi:hypothetical protein SARC_07059, partial [Sphaeroforma arctica JP610]
MSAPNRSAFADSVLDDRDKQVIPYMIESSLQLYNPGIQRHISISTDGRLPLGWRVILNSPEERRVVLYNAREHQIVVQNTHDAMQRSRSSTQSFTSELSEADEVLMV